jgi:hypothetical protein
MDNDQRAEVIIATPVARLSAERCVQALEDCGGDITAFLKVCGNPLDRPEAYTIAMIERSLKSDKDLHKRWQDAKKQYKVLGLEMLQNRAIDRLKTLVDEENGWLLMAKEAAAHKLILGDILAGQAHLAKQKPTELPPEDSDDDDEAELAAIMEGA